MAADGTLGVAGLALLFGLWRGLPSFPWSAASGEPPATELTSLECRCHIGFAPSSVVREHLVLLLVIAAVVFLTGVCCGVLGTYALTRPRVHSNKTGRLALYG